MSLIDLKNTSQEERESILFGREWLETNGIGGFCGSTVAGCHTRRYHGALVAAIEPPIERSVLISKLDESVEFAGKIVDLSTSYFPGTIHPDGFKYLDSFSRDLYPEWTYSINELITIRKSLIMLHGENTVIVRYELLEAPTPIELCLNPKMAFRDYHSLRRAGDNLAIKLDFGQFICKDDDGLEGYLNFGEAKLSRNLVWYYNYILPREKERGYDYQEDLLSIGEARITLKKGESRYVALSTINPNGRPLKKLFDLEIDRRRSIIRACDPTSDVERRLVLAADQFIVTGRNNDYTIIAGYPWFTDWGRDTMIALPGVAILTNRLTEAKRIITKFLNNMDGGLIPNLFPNKSGKPMYNTIDASLWMFIAILKYFEASNDLKFVEQTALPKLREIIEHHINGTKFGIKVTSESLLQGGNPQVQLTWMDAKINETVVTPRDGLAVEINALWINALYIMARLSSACSNESESNYYKILGAAAKRSFQHTFWNESAKYLADVVKDGVQDLTFRPNQIIAISLPFEVVTKEQGALITSRTILELGTKHGLRTLPKGNKDYHSKYEGDQEHRDLAYHQGTVWGWLLGPYVETLLRYGGHQGMIEAQKVVDNLCSDLSNYCIGTLGEIYDGDYPHSPRGAVAQAWSVGEAIRAIKILRSKNVNSEAGDLRGQDKKE